MVSEPDRTNLEVMRICSILSCVFLLFLFWLGEDKKLPLILLLVLMVMLFRYWMVCGRTLVMNEAGCIISLLWYKKQYRWDELVVKRIDRDFKVHQEPYNSAVIFSPHTIHKAKTMDPGEYCFLFHPLSVFFVYFMPETDGYYDTIRFDKWKAANKYAIEEKLFREKMKEWGIELTETK